MPDAKLDTVAALDVDRFQQVAQMADLAENLWAAVCLAAERGDADIIAHHAKQLRILTRSFLETVKTLGKEEPNA